MHSLVYEIFPVHHSLQNWTQIGACVHGWWRPPPRLASWHQHETCRLLTTAQWRLVDNFFVVDHTTVTDPTSRHQVLAYLVMHCRCQMIIIYHFISFSCIFDLYSCCHITGYRRMLLTAANCRRRQLVCFDCLFLYYILSINVEGFMQDLNCNIFMTVHKVYLKICALLWILQRTFGMGTLSFSHCAPHALQSESRSPKLCGDEILLVNYKTCHETCSDTESSL